MNSSPDPPDVPAAALTDSPEGVAVLDDGTVVAANRAFADAHGLGREAVVGDAWAECYDDPEAARAALAAADDGGWRGELAGTTPDGEAFVVSVVLSAAGDGRTVAFARDVTDRVERRRELEWYETVLTHVQDPVYALDNEGRITYVNEYVLETYDVDYDREQLLGEYISVVLDPEDINRSLSVIRELLADPERDSGKCEVTIRTGDGGEIPAELHIALLPPDARRGPGTVGVIRDVTERKRREQGLSVLQRVLRHNVRNNTTAILGYAETLRDAVPEDDREKLDEIRSAATELDRLSEKARHVQNAIDRRDVRAKPVDVAAVLADRRETYEERFPAADIRMDLPETALATAGESIDVVLDEAVENAVRHNAGDEPRVAITVETDRGEASASPGKAAGGEAVDAGDGAEADGGDRGRVLVRVDDDGSGIPEEERAVLSGGSEDPLYHGSGLGLWLVRWFVDTYDGDLSFGESEWGGSSVRIALPAADPGG